MSDTTKPTRPQVGQILYRLNIGNNARHREQVLLPVIVTKVGRKSFTVKRMDGYAIESEHYIDGWREVSDFIPGWQLYTSEQAWSDEKEQCQLIRKLQQEFTQQGFYHSSKFPLETLRQVAAILWPTGE